METTPQKVFQRQNSITISDNKISTECNNINANTKKESTKIILDNNSANICRVNTCFDEQVNLKNVLTRNSFNRSSAHRGSNRSVRSQPLLNKVQPQQQQQQQPQQQRNGIEKQFLRKTKSAQTPSELQKKLKVSVINNMFLSTNELATDIESGAKRITFPHCDPENQEGNNNKANSNNANSNRKQLRRITGSLLSRTPRQHRTTSADLIKELLYPADTPLNIRLFGGRKGVEMEIERSKKSGCIIHPCSKLRQYWDLLIMTMLIINMFVLPLDIAFFESNTLVGFHVMSDVLCLMDIALNFRTGYRCSLEKQEFELDQKKVAIHYLKTWFTLDIISSLPLNYIILAVTGQNLTLGLKGASRALKILKVAKLLNLLKLLRLSRIIRGISQYEEVYCLTTGLMRYIKLVSMMLVVAHWNGCLHFLVPMLQDFPKSCWVARGGLQHQPWYKQYGWALFKTLSHMLCIGYGQFIPVLLSEATVTIFSMVTGATFYALFIAHSMAYIIQRDASKSSYQEKLKEIDEYLHYRNVPDPTKKRISNYFEHKYHHGRFFNEEEILSVMGKPLRNEIVYHTCRDIVASVPFLKTGPKHFVDELLKQLKFEVYLSGDAIITEGNYGTEMFFLRKGCADITLRNREIAQLTDGAYFGENCMLTDDARHLVTVKARSTCDVFSLSYRHLNYMLGEHPEMRSVMEQTALNKLIQIHHKVEVALAEQHHVVSESDQPAFDPKKPEPIKHRSSLTQMKEVLNSTVESLARRIRKFKHDDESLFLETLSDDEIEESCYDDDFVVQDGGDVTINNQNVATAF